MNDGCLQEGNSHESRNDNGFYVNGRTELSLTEDAAERYEANDWQVLSGPARGLHR
jgi:transketolase